MIQKWGGGEVLKKAVRGMLPKNRLRNKRLERLKVFEGEAHPYGSNIVKFAGEDVLPQGEILEAVQKMEVEESPEKVGSTQA